MPPLLTRRNIFIWISIISVIFVLWTLVNVKKEPEKIEIRVAPHVIVERVVTSQHSIPLNSRFRVTKESKAYDVNSNPSCHAYGCDELNNKKSFGPCENEDATEWLILGVHKVVRYLNGDISGMPDYNKNSLIDAETFFEKAKEIDPQCAQAHMNLGMTKLALDKYKESIPLFKEAIELYTDDVDRSEAYLFLAFGTEMNKGDFYPIYDTAVKLNSNISKKFNGVYFTNSRSNNFNQLETIRDFSIYNYFSPVSIAGYGLLEPGTQDFFIENRYAILRKLLPPFVLNSFARYNRLRIASGELKLGDGQSKRYVSYNDRCSRYIQYQLTDYVRRVIAHNAKPTYTYFGGYLEGSELKPHVDRKQCEFTMSLAIEQYPHNETWLLSLGKRPMFDRHHIPFKIEMPPENEIVDADLYAGDALLFMGRHLIHFRRGSLPAGRWANQVFLHYVQEDFSGPLD